MLPAQETWQTETLNNLKKVLKGLTLQRSPQPRDKFIAKRETHRRFDWTYWVGMIHKRGALQHARRHK